MIRLSRLLRLKDHVNRAREMIGINPGIARLILLLSMILLFIHWAACLWHFVGVQSVIAFGSSWIKEKKVVSALSASCIDSSDLLQCQRVSRH
jgi:hypothetical protein